MMRRRGRVTTWVALAAVATGGVAGRAVAGDVAIMPSMVEMSVEPGRDSTTVVQIHCTKDGPRDTRPIRVILGTENWSMNTAGDLAFTAKPVAFSAKPWIRYSPGEAQIEPGEILTVRVSVIVPEGTEGGEYRAALIARPRTPFRPVTDGERRLELIARLAAILYVEVPPVVADVELSSLRVTRLRGHHHVVSQFYNPGSRHLRIHDSFEILPLADPPSLTTCARDEIEAGVVLPGQTRQFLHPLPCDLAPGWYKLLYRADLGDELPRQEGETTFVIPPTEREAVASAPEEAVPPTD